MKWRSCLVYCEDVIIFSSSEDEHIDNLDGVLSALSRAGVSLKAPKCHFFKKSVDYLGRVIRPGRLSLAEKNTLALKEAKNPTTQTELRSFIGLRNIYRRFLPKFAQIAAPLTSMLQKGQPATIDTLTTAQADAFDELRRAQLNPPILALPRGDGLFILDTDASDTQLGCCLLQEQPSGDRLPVGYWSRTLLAAEKKYHVTERECLAVVWAVTLLRPYLEGIHFAVGTDHAALRWILNLSTSGGRLEHWRLRLL